MYIYINLHVKKIIDSFPLLHNLWQKSIAKPMKPQKNTSEKYFSQENSRNFLDFHEKEYKV